MPPGGFVSFSIRAELMKKVDDFLEKNDDGFGSRAEVISTAIREFLERRAPRPPV